MRATIKIEDIELLLTKTIKKLKEDKHTEFSFEYDEYWIITTDEWNKFDAEPKPAVGSLNDDINFLKSVIKEDLNISYLELERLASILRALSEVLTADASSSK